MYLVNLPTEISRVLNFTYLTKISQLFSFTDAKQTTIVLQAPKLTIYETKSAEQNDMQIIYMIDYKKLISGQEDNLQLRVRVRSESSSSS